MSTHDFFLEAARRKVTEAIARAEQKTSAEIVVALRPASASYRAAELLFAAFCAMGTLIIMLFIPAELPLWSFVFDVAIVFAAAAWLARLLPSVQRGLTPEDERVRNVRAGASHAFLTRAIHRCKGRNGVLVYASVLEGFVEAVADIGIDPKTLEPARSAAQKALADRKLDGFVKAIEDMGDALAPAHPRRDDDANELPDEVDA
jgi:putative membrane protein